MRRETELSSDAVALVLYLSRQRLRLAQDIPQSELRAVVNGDGARLAAAIAECVRGGWLLVTRSARTEPHYSMLAAARKSVARLLPRLQ